MGNGEGREERKGATLDKFYKRQPKGFWRLNLDLASTCSKAISWEVGEFGDTSPEIAWAQNRRGWGISMQDISSTEESQGVGSVSAPEGQICFGIAMTWQAICRLEKVWDLLRHFSLGMGGLPNSSGVAGVVGVSGFPWPCHIVTEGLDSSWPNTPDDKYWILDCWIPPPPMQ